MFFLLNFLWLVSLHELVYMFLFLDSIKNLWKTARSDDLVPLKRVEIFKSSFDNLFVDEDPKAYKYYFNSDKIPYHFNELQEKANDFRNLQVNLKPPLDRCKYCQLLGSYRNVKEDKGTERRGSELTQIDVPYSF